MIWSERFSALRSLFDGADYSALWVPKEDVTAVLDRAGARFAQDYAALDAGMAYIFSDDQDIDLRTRRTIELTRGWHLKGEAPSLAALVSVAMANLGFDPAVHGNLIDGVLTAAVLGDIRNDLPYHNNLHFCKVTLHVARMIAAHNRIFSGTPRAFDIREMAALLICGAIHDLGHDGSRNIVDHKYYFALLEKYSFDAARLFLQKAGIDADLLEDIRTIILTTDVSPFGDPISPANQLRAAYEYNYGTTDSDEPELSEELTILKDRADLCMMCVIMHEADLMNSTGLGYEVTTYETVLLSAEIGKQEALPEDLILFLETICRGGMMSDAWQWLAAENFAAIHARTVQDYKNGNRPYPAAADCPFITGA